jgi:hypothetical protein
VGTGTTDATAAGTTDVLMDVLTHDLYPTGAAGDSVFRGVDVRVRHSAGASIGVTPIVDGVELPEQTFTFSAPSVGDGVDTAEARFARRGVRVAARVRQTVATGDVELVDVAAWLVPLREAP